MAFLNRRASSPLRRARLISMGVSALALTIGLTVSTAAEAQFFFDSFYNSPYPKKSKVKRSRPASVASSVFFERQTCLQQHSRQRGRMRRHILLGSQFGCQFRHRDIRLGFDPLEQGRQVRRQFAAARRTSLSRRRRRSGPPYPIGQLHRKACTDCIAASRCTSRLPALHFGLNALPKVNRIGLSHPYWPPYPASILNQTFDSLGIPFRFLFQARCSSQLMSPPTSTVSQWTLSGM